MRYFYTFLLYLALPLIIVRLWVRSSRAPLYRRRILERFGFYKKLKQECIWIHAVSVGETVAAAPLISALQTKYPHIPFLITTMTPTGSERVKSLFGDGVQHVYLPYDYPGAVSRFLNKTKPLISIIVERELWPNLVSACKARHIPVCLVNARLSLRSTNQYKRVASLTSEMMQSLTLILAVSQSDAERFKSLGARPDSIEVTGNVKFDLSIPAVIDHSLREKLGTDRFVWIAASTHPGEEALIIEAHKRLLDIDPHALLILVPRHNDRFNDVAKQCETVFNIERHSEDNHSNSETQLYLGDTMGDLLTYYNAADVAFIGGSLIPHGGHNMIEPAALGKAIMAGPYLFNFARESELFYEKNALIKIKDAEALYENLIALLHDADERKAQGARAKAVVEANRGVLDKQLAFVTRLIV